MMAMLFPQNVCVNDGDDGEKNIFDDQKTIVGVSTFLNSDTNRRHMSEELENRLLLFALHVRNFCRKLKWDVINIEYIRQLIRASSSVGANFVEASDDLGKSDEKMKLKISRREAKEPIHFLNLVSVDDNEPLERERVYLLSEGLQIRKILSAILLKL